MQTGPADRTRSPLGQSRPAACLALLASISMALLLTACGSLPAHRAAANFSTPPLPQPISQTGDEVAIYALDLIGTGYRFGGKNPQAGLDCSGMVSYIYREAAGIKVLGSAADIAKRGREIDPSTLRPGDLVFFNTEHKPFSHVAIYIGDNRFVHAPSTNGHVRIDRLDNRYYAERYEMARRYFD
ncbi:MAG TPA: C40 family peptidase [Herbaspirillum sp.]|jgi:cell wall-associated NlpC family hydrolase